MKKWNNRIKNRKNKTQIRKNNKIKIDKIEIKNKMSNKAFGKMKKAGKTHNRGSTPQTAWYWIRSKKFLTIG